MWAAGNLKSVECMYRTTSEAVFSGLGYTIAGLPLTSYVDLFVSPSLYVYCSS